MFNDSMRIFDDLELGMLRATMHDDGEAWFVLQDICRILGQESNSAVADAAARLEPCEKGMDIIHTLGGDQEMVTVSEGGLYYLICTSRKPNAKKFRLWVTGTVLVSIRKNKGYVLGQEDLPEEKQEEIAEVLQEKSPVKRNPMEFTRAYVAKDGTVFTNWVMCKEYERELWN